MSTVSHRGSRPFPVSALLPGDPLATRLPRDHYVRLDANDYSVHPSAVGRLAEISADLDQVVVTCGGAEAARHARCRAARQTLADPARAVAAAQMRQARRLATAPAARTAVEQRSLADYDRLFGLTGEVTR